MTTAIVAPEYFVGLDMLGCMLTADQVVLADTYQYVRQSLQNRARIRTPDGIQWITVPVDRGQLGQPIDQIRIDRLAHWPAVHERALQFQYGRAAFFEHFKDDIGRIIRIDTPQLADITCESATWVYRVFGGAGTMIRASQLPARPQDLDGIARAVGATRICVVSAGGRLPQECAVPIVAIEVTPVPYHQAFDGFESGMSSLDVLLNLGPHAADSLRTWAVEHSLPSPASAGRERSQRA